AVAGFSILSLALAPSVASAITIFSSTATDPTDPAQLAAFTANVDAFRAALGGGNNGNAPGPLASGRRGINWDGGTATDGTVATPPFLVFQNTRGATFTTPVGPGLSQTPIVGGTVDIDPTTAGLQGSLSDFNVDYANTFTTFSPNRLFVSLDSTTTDGSFS